MTESFLHQTTRLTDVETSKGKSLTMYEANMSDEGKDTKRLHSFGCEVAYSAFNIKRISPQLEKEIYDDMIDHHIVFALNLQGEPVGFGSFDLVQKDEKKILHVVQLITNKEVRKQGVGTEIVKQALKSAEETQTIDCIAGITQSPILAEAIIGCCDPVYPITALPDEEVINLGRALQGRSKIQEPMHPVTLITKDVLVPSLLKKRFQSELPAINAFFKQYVGPRDAAFIIGRPRI